jgi:hypothetical protein
MLSHMHAYIHARMRAYMHAYTHTYIHTYYSTVTSYILVSWTGAALHRGDIDVEECDW